MPSVPSGADLSHPVPFKFAKSPTTVATKSVEPPVKSLHPTNLTPEGETGPSPSDSSLTEDSSTYSSESDSSSSPNLSVSSLSGPSSAESVISDANSSSIKLPATFMKVMEEDWGPDYLTDPS